MSGRDETTPPGLSRRDNTRPPEEALPWPEALKDGGRSLPDDHPLYRDGAQLFIVRRPREAPKPGTAE